MAGWAHYLVAIHLSPSKTGWRRWVRRQVEPHGPDGRRGVAFGLLSICAVSYYV